MRKSYILKLLNGSVMSKYSLGSHTYTHTLTLSVSFCVGVDPAGPTEVENQRENPDG